MPKNYSPAPEVERIARGVIRDHHQHLVTNDVTLLYLFVDEAEKEKNKVTLATARKLSGLPAYLARFRLDRMQERYNKDGGLDFFVITVWEQWWRSRSTTDDQRRALVDHELCHCFSEEKTDKDGKPTGQIGLTLLPHDITEFNVIASRHGAWQPDIDAFLDAFHGDEEVQPGLFDEDAVLASPAQGESGQVDSVTLSYQGSSVTLSPEQLRETRDRLHQQAAGRGQ